MRTRKRKREEGTALVVALLVTLVLAGLSYSMTAVTSGSYVENKAYSDRTRVFYIADAGLNEAIAILTSRGIAALKAERYPKVLGGITYRIDAVFGDESQNLADDLIQIVATAQERDNDARIETMLRITSSPGGEFDFGVFGDQHLSLDSNAGLDAWDSSAGSYSSQLTGKHHGIDYAKKTSQAASNGDIDLDSNSFVFGEAHPGPSGSVSTSSNSFVTGSTTPSPETVSFPQITVPTLLPTGNFEKDKGKHTLLPGDYRFGKLVMDSNSRLTIVGPARVVVNEFEVNSNSEVYVNSAAGAVEFWITGKFKADSNSEFRPLNKLPKDLKVNYTGTDTASFSSNTEFWGSFIAPNADVEVDSNVEIFGILGGKSMVLKSNSMVHVDEALIGGGSGGSNTNSGLSLNVLSWRPY